MTTVLLDNYDSFAWNLFQYLGELGERPVVVRNDRMSVAEIAALEPSRIVISPGPGNPENASYFGIGHEVIRTLGRTIPILGVCLGHQGIVSAFGGRIVRAPEPMHGKTSLIHHDGSTLFRGVPSPFTAMRYHSLVADRSTFPDCLEVTATTTCADDLIIMGARHRTFPIYGVQFHPESIGTPDGKRILRNFLDCLSERVGVGVGHDRDGVGIVSLGHRGRDLALVGE